MDVKFIFAILIAGILLFGCISNEGMTKTNKTTTSGSENKSQDTSGTNGANITGTTTTTTTTTNASSNQTNITTTATTGGQTTTVDYSSKTWTELVALNSAVECAVTYKDEAAQAGIKSMMIYMKGSKMKSVTTLKPQAGQTTETVMTVLLPNDNYVYMNYNDPTLMQAFSSGKSCDWIKLEATSSSPSNPNPSADLADDSKVSLDCKPGTFGDEIFQVTGTTCDMPSWG